MYIKTANGLYPASSRVKVKLSNNFSHCVHVKLFAPFSISSSNVRSFLLGGIFWHREIVSCHSFAVSFVCMYFVDFFYDLQNSISYFIVVWRNINILMILHGNLSSRCSILLPTKAHIEEIRPLSKLVYQILSTVLISAVERWDESHNKCKTCLLPFHSPENNFYRSKKLYVSDDSH